MRVIANGDYKDNYHGKYLFLPSYPTMSMPVWSPTSHCRKAPDFAIPAKKNKKCYHCSEVTQPNSWDMHS
jgi:hypothetical protein